MATKPPERTSPTGTRRRWVLPTGWRETVKRVLADAKARKLLKRRQR
jgi:hypothetical protein